MNGFKNFKIRLIFKISPMPRDLAQGESFWNLELEYEITDRNLACRFMRLVNFC